MPNYFPEQNIPGISTVKSEIGAGAYWRDMRMEYSSGNIVYKGTHRKINALTTDTGWVITKYTWDGDNIVRAQGPLPGTWDDRETLDW